MTEVVILGAGNIATHLYNAFSNAKNVKVIQVFNHNPEHLSFFEDKVATISTLSEIAEADVYFLALKDDAVSKIAKKLNERGALVVHTSGGLSIEILSNFRNYGVFYPLQTFSKGKPVDFSTIPVCIEANSTQNAEILKKLASEITENIYEIASEQRQALHVAAVFVNNFTNHLYTLGAEICEENNLPFQVLQPLIKETALKIESLNPFEAQTGPAVRNDENTIKAHLELLNENQQKIYKTLTQSIQEFHGKKL